MLERILVVKLADLGDVLLSEPAIRSLRTAFPAATIDVLTTPAAARLLPMFGLDLGIIEFQKRDFDTSRPGDFLRGAGKLAGLTARLRRGKYDAVAILHHLTTPAGAFKFRLLAAAAGADTAAGLDNGRGTFLTHTVTDLGFGMNRVVDDMLRVASKLGGAHVDPAPRLMPSAWLAADLPVPVQQPFAAIFPLTGPFAPGRDWPVESFGKLAQLLSRRGIVPVIAGAEEASAAARVICAQAPQAIDLTGKTNLHQLTALISAAAVTITGDSFPGHLAAAVQAPLVSIFGPSNHRAWAPYGAVELDALREGNACIIRNDVPCSPCLYTGFRLGRRNGCASRICLTHIHAEQVMAGVEAVIGKRP